MQKSIWLKIYILIIVLICTAFVGVNIYVQAQGAPPTSFYFCAKTEDISIDPRISNCNSGFHIEGNACVSNVGAGGFQWQGSIYNGIWGLTPVTNVLPTINITEPSNNASFIQPDIVIRAKADDSDGKVDAVEFYYNSNYLGRAASPTAGGIFSYEWKGMQEGTYTVTAKAVDNLGGASVSAPISVTYALNIPPELNITQPADGAEIHVPGNATIKVTASDLDDYLATVEVFEREAIGGLDVSICNFTNLNSYGPIDKDCLWTNPPIGDYIITVNAADVGGKTTQKQINLHVVNDPPTITLIQPSPTGRFRFPPYTALTLKANAADDVQVAEVKFFEKGAADPTYFFLGNGEQVTPGVFQLTWTASNVLPGTYNLKAVVTDNAGLQTTSSEVMFIIAEEICGNNIDDDGDGSLINGCATINFNIYDNATTPKDYYYVYISDPSHNLPFAPIVDAENGIIDGKISGSKNFNYSIKAQDTEYLIKVVSIASSTGSTKSTLNVNINGVAGNSLVYINPENVYDYTTGGTGANQCQNITSNNYKCDLSLPACNTYTFCSPPTEPDPGYATFEVRVLGVWLYGGWFNTPKAGQTFTVGSNIKMSIDGRFQSTISKVEFYQQEQSVANPTLLSTITSSPWVYTWQNVPAGTYNLTAKVYAGPTYNFSTNGWIYVQ